MENQGKKWSQMKDSETFAFIAIVMIVIVMLIMLASCGQEARATPEEEKVYIHMSDGNKVQLVADEYGGQYLKQCPLPDVYIYIPYTGEIEDTSDTLQFYNVKNK